MVMYIIYNYQAMGITADDIKLRSQSFYTGHNIEIQLGKEVLCGCT